MTFFTFLEAERAAQNYELEVAGNYAVTRDLRWETAFIAEKIERVSPVTQQQLEHIFRGKGRMAQQVKWWLAWQRYCQSEISKQPAAD